MKLSKIKLSALLLSYTALTPHLFAQKAPSNTSSSLSVQDVAQKNLEEGRKFLAQNKKKKGVVTLKNGLQYKIIKKGKGPKPKLTDTVKVHYEGRLLNGQIFDSSFQRNTPAEFPLTRVIVGWQEGVQLMNVGSEYEFFIPSDLAYGPNGAGSAIPPNATLIFKIHLLDKK
jgi:FKBP-type peptidyl-prolyl cis-trans isomerase FklB